MEGAVDVWVGWVRNILKIQSALFDHVPMTRFVIVQSIVKDVLLEVSLPRVE